MTDDRIWDHPGQEHQDRTLYARYHRDIYLPSEVRQAAEAFLPLRGTTLPLSEHYRRVQANRKLPDSIYMPYAYSIIEVTTAREAKAVFRVMIRAPWNRTVDIVIVLEGDFEIVTAFYASPKDDHLTLDPKPYEAAPLSSSERQLLAAIEDTLEGGQ